MLLLQRFWYILEHSPEDPAIEAKGASISYRELGHIVLRLATDLRSCGAFAPRDFVPVVGDKHTMTYAAHLAILICGGAFVPTNSRFPIVRTLDSIKRSHAKLVLSAGADMEKVKALSSLTRIIDILPHGEKLPRYEDPLPELRRLSVEMHWDQAPDAPAYLLFTSGTTGKPKGVMITRGNLEGYLDRVISGYCIGAGDRLSQLFDLTFDLSVHDTFCALLSGACLVIPEANEQILPMHYLRQREITISFCVPSTAQSLADLRQLKPDSFPDLRLSLFCGEAMGAELAQQWFVAAPNSIIENLYGPTEATIAFTRYRWDADHAKAHSVNGLLPIGAPFEGLACAIIDEEGGEGELVLIGDQVAEGYFEDPDRSSGCFLPSDGVAPERVCAGDPRLAASARAFRTGDRVCRAEDGTLVFLGRRDTQIKIKGYRADLMEIESIARDTFEVGTWIVVPKFDSRGGIKELIAFVHENDAEKGSSLQLLAKRLPHYMVPARVECVSDWPKNASGKLDRKALQLSLSKK
jgi:amino acid adenylation domain-containing protein